MGTWRFRNVTQAANFDPLLGSVTITNQQPCQLATFDGEVRASEPIAQGDEVAVFYAEDNVTEVKVFAGDVSVLTDAHVEPGGDPALLRFSARDFTARLDDTIITDGKRMRSETALARVNWIMDRDPTFDITTGGVATITDVVDGNDYTGMSRSAALSHVAGLVGAVLYVDFDKELQFYLADSAIPAAFDLVTPASPPTSYAYREFTYDRDVTDMATDVFVLGDGVSTWRPNATPSGGKQRAVVNTSIKSLVTARQVGDMELERIGDPVVRGSLQTLQPGLNSGETVHVTNPAHAIDADYVISRVSVRPFAPNGGDKWDALYEVEFSDRLLCAPALDVTDIDDNPDDGCSRVTFLPTGMTDNLSLESGGGEQVFVHDGDQLVKYRLELDTEVWAVSAAGGVPYVTHQPGTYVPALLGDTAYRRDDGTQRWDIQSDISAVAAQAQDRDRYWVTVEGEADIQFVGVTENDALGIPAGWQVGDLAIVFAHAFHAITVGTGWTQIENDTAGTDNAVSAYRVLQAGDSLPGDWANYDSHLTCVVYRGASGVAGSDSSIDGTYPITSVPVPAMSAGDFVVSIYYGLSSIGTDTPSGMTNRNGGTTVGVADVAGDFAGDTLTSGIASFFTAAHSIGLTASGGGGGGAAHALHVRESIDGSLFDSVALSAEGASMRRSASGQFVMVQQGTDTIERYDRSPALQDTVTIADFFPCDEWCVDDARNLYRLDGGVVTKYDPTGVELTSADLTTREGYAFTSLATGTGNQMLADDFVRVVGTVGDNGVLLTLAKSTLDTKEIRYFQSDTTAEAEAVHHHVNGNVYVAGQATGTEFEGETMPASPVGWIMLLCNNGTTDTGGEGGNDPSHTHDIYATDTDLADHVNDTADAHDASAISIADSGGYFTGTDVEAALQELGAGGGGGGGGSVATDGIWDAKGDLAVGTGANTAAKLTAGTDGDVLTLDSGETTGVKWAAPAAGGDTWITVRKGSNESRNTTATLAVDGALTQALTSGHMYVVEGLLIYDGNAAGDIRVTFGEDGTNRGVVYGIGLSNADNAQQVGFKTQNVSPLHFGAGADKRGIYITGWYLSGGGTFGVYWAQSASNAANTTIYAGSYMRFRDIT